MGNAKTELIGISESFGKKRIVADHVDNDGIIDIFRYFNLA